MCTTRTAVAIVAILAAVALLAPGALAHGDEHDGGSDGADGNQTDAYDGPHPHLRGYDIFLDRPFWGSIDRITGPAAGPSSPAVSPGWIVWIDGSSDLVGYNLTTNVRVQITDDDLTQRSPDIDGSQVVWRERDGTEQRVRYYDIEAGRSRVLYESGGTIQEPTIEGRWVAWQVREDRSGASHSSWDIRAYDLENGRTLPVATGPETDVDPAIVGDHLAWRQREYTQWDVRVEDLTSGREVRATADVNEERHLRAGPQGFMFTKEQRGTHDRTVYRYYPSSERLVDTGYRAPRSTGAFPIDDGFLFLQPYVRNRTLVLHSDEAGLTDRLHEGRLDIVDMATPAGRTVPLVVDHGDGHRLVTFTYSRLAELPRPRVVIEDPEEGSTVTNLTTVRGQVLPRDWPDPAKVYVSVAGSPTWAPAEGATTWQATIDLSNLPAGRHVIQVAAEFPGGPPQDNDVRVLVGQPLDFTQDLSPNFETQARDVVTAILATIPLLVVLILLVVAVLLLLARTYLRWLHERFPEARYVPPDDPSAPRDHPAEASGGDGGSGGGDGA